MNQIRLISHASNGHVSFLVKSHTYAYRWLDGPVLAEVRKLAEKKSGEALNVAKRHCDQWRKDAGPWQDNNPDLNEI